MWALLLLLMLGAGCNQRQTSQATTKPTTTNAALTFPPEDFSELGIPATNGSTKQQEFSDADLGLSGPWNDYQQNEQRIFGEAKVKAEKGDAESQARLGALYQFGKGVSTNYDEAAKWFRKAAEQDNFLGQWSLAQCYEEGKGVAKDSASASEWRKKALDNPQLIELIRGEAERGNMAQQAYLGLCYQIGRAVPRNLEESVRWYRKAADQGHPDSQASLAQAYFVGNGVAENRIEAMKWARKAAEQGFALGQGLLGAGYADGSGVPKNDIEAYKWLALAASQGLPKDMQEVVKATLDSLGLRMSRGEIVEAQRLAGEFAPRNEAATKPQRTGLFDDIIAEQSARPKASGTGFFITADGFVISNAHVPQRGTKVRLVTNAGLIDAKIVKVDVANDLALLKAEGRFAALPVKSSRGVKLGNTVATVGFPNIGLQGFAPKLAKGEIASLSGAADDARYFQISVPVQPGNSGGALVDERGNVVGVVSAKLNARAAFAASGALPENVNYAVKSSFLLGFLESVPEVAAKLKEPNTQDRKFEDVVKAAEQAAVLVLVY